MISQMSSVRIPFKIQAKPKIFIASNLTMGWPRGSLMTLVLYSF